MERSGGSGRHVLPHSPHGLQVPQAPQPCSSLANSESGFSSHTGEGMGSEPFSIGEHNGSAPRTTCSPPSPAGNRYRGHPGRSILGTEPLPCWALLGLSSL